jgi:MFS superfamily sulfate permease-like transporter
VSVVALALLFMLPRLSKRIPGGLLVLFGSIALSSALDLAGTHGVEVVGTLPGGLPSVAFPQVPLADYLGMVLPAIGVLLVVFSESLGTANEFAEKHGYEVNANQELNAHAVANIFSALFGGMIAGGSMSASAVKEGAGARTQVSNLVTWLATIVTLLFLTPLFATLPEAVLGALIIHAVWHILAARKLVKLRQSAPVEVWFGVLAMAGVLFVDVLQGMIIGVVTSLVFVVYRSTRPHVASLGRVPGVPGAYSDLARHPDDIPVPGVLIVRIDAQMYYANALTVRDTVKEMVASMEPPPKALILDASAQDEIDITSTDALAGLVKQLREKNIDVYVAEVHAPVLERSREVIGEDHAFSTVDAAVRHVEGKLNQDGEEVKPDSPSRSTE